MKNKKVWGIELVLLHDSPVGSIPRGERGQRHAWTYQVRLAQRTTGQSQNPNKMFISSKELHARLEEGAAAVMFEMIGNELGTLQCEINEKKRTITTLLLNPFEYAPGRQSHPFTDVFARLGLATRLEQRMEEHLLRFFPGYSIQSSPSVSPLRRSQLEKRGRIVGEAIRLERALQLSRDHARKNLEKNRIRPRTPKRK